MSRNDQALERLFKSAARAARPLPQEAPFTLEAKVLAQWRASASGAGDLAQSLLPLLRRAALCACLLMLLSIAFSYRAFNGGEDEEVAIANSAVDLTALP